MRRSVADQKVVEARMKREARHGANELEVARNGRSWNEQLYPHKLVDAAHRLSRTHREQRRQQRLRKHFVDLGTDKVERVQLGLVVCDVCSKGEVL